MYPILNWNACTHCGECIPVCPENIFSFDYDGLMAYSGYDKCIGCGQCSETCPENAITYGEDEDD